MRVGDHCYSDMSNIRNVGVSVYASVLWKLSVEYDSLVEQTLQELENRSGFQLI